MGAPGTGVLSATKNEIQTALNHTLNKIIIVDPYNELSDLPGAKFNNSVDKFDPNDRLTIINSNETFLEKDIIDVLKKISALQNCHIFITDAGRLYSNNYNVQDFDNALQNVLTNSTNRITFAIQNVEDMISTQAGRNHVQHAGHVQITELTSFDKPVVESLLN